MWHLTRTAVIQHNGFGLTLFELDEVDETKTRQKAQKNGVKTVRMMAFLTRWFSSD